MKKLFLIAIIACSLSTSCKKEYCYTCTSTVTGNDEELCSMTKKDAERKESQGYTCRRK